MLRLLRCGVARHLRRGERILEVGREGRGFGGLERIVAEGRIRRRRRRAWKVPIDITAYS